MSDRLSASARSDNGLHTATAEEREIPRVARMFVRVRPVVAAPSSRVSSASMRLGARCVCDRVWQDVCLQMMNARIVGADEKAQTQGNENRFIAGLGSGPGRPRHPVPSDGGMHRD